MWNKTEADKKYYEMESAHNAKRKSALDKARNRGSMMESWTLAGNKLTKETMAEFKAIMKTADADWDEAHK